MSDHADLIAMAKSVRRESDTEKRIRALDVHEIVAHVHSLEDTIESLEAALAQYENVIIPAWKRDEKMWEAELAAVRAQLAEAGRDSERMRLVPVEPQPDYIESSGRWTWPLPPKARFPGCCTSVCTASREWWEYAPSEAKPHPMSEATLLRNGRWYWTLPAAKHKEQP